MNSKRPAGRVRNAGSTFTSVLLLLFLQCTQLQSRGRTAYDGEDSYLRRAIGCYEFGDDVSAVDRAYRAAINGSTLLVGEMVEPDRSVPLPDLLRKARAVRASDPTP